MQQKYLLKLIPTILIISIASIFSSCEVLSELDSEDGSTGLTKEEIIKGLKEALEKGADSTITKVSASNGYFKDEAIKILLPETVQQSVDKISNSNNFLVTLAWNTFGGKDKLDELTQLMNHSAEDAAKSAKPIFVNAITNMSISDGVSILNGSDSSATNYLKTNTITDLTAAYSPIIDKSLDKNLIDGINLSTNDLWSTLNTLYSAVSAIIDLPAIDADGTLGEYVTKKALDGLFLKIAEEEKKIRKDPKARVTDILEKVFGSLDN